MQKNSDDTNSGKSGHGSKARKREQLIAALLVARNYQMAAEQCGLSVSTVRRWMQDAEFVEALREAKAQLVIDTTTQLRAAGTEAVATLREILSDKAAQPPARVSASRAVLEFLFHSVQAEELEDRLNKLEEERDEDGQ